MMHIHASLDLLPPSCVSIDALPLEIIHSAKPLGLTIDKQTWYQHVNNHISSATCQLYSLQRIKKLEKLV